MNAETFLADADAPPSAEDFLTDAPSAEAFLDDQPGAIAGTVNEFKRGLLTGQQALVAAQLEAAPKAPTMRQLRKGYVTAMSDPRYQTALTAAGNDPARLQRVEETLGPTAQVGRVESAIRLNRQFIAEDVAKLEAAAQAIPASEAMTEWNNADNSNWAKVLARNPFEITAGIMAQSFPAMAPALAATVVAPGGKAGRALAAGAGSYGVESAHAFLDSARQTGYDFTDPQKVQEFFDNPAAQAKAREYAARRGVPIAVLDALTAGFAGKFVGPALKQGAGKVAVRSAAEIGMQAAGGAGGETLAQLNTGKKLSELSAKDIVAEGLGEMASGPVEVLSNLRNIQQPTSNNQHPEASRPDNDELPPLLPPDFNLSPPGQSDVARSAEAATGADPSRNVPAAAVPTAAAPEQSGGGIARAASDETAQRAVPTPEDPRTIAAQMRMLIEGKRSAVLITEGEAMPEVPGNMKTVELEGYGTMIYSPRVHREESIIARAKEDKLGRILGFSVDRKPKPGTEVGVVTIRTAEGVEKQAEVTDEKNLPAATKAAEKIADPQDTVQLEPAEQVIEGRIAQKQTKETEEHPGSALLTPLPSVQVLPRHLSEARAALETERPPSVHDDIAGEVTSGPVRFPEADFRDMLDTVRDELAQEQFQKPYKKLRKEQRAKVDRAHRMSVSEGMPAAEVLNAIARDNPKYESWSVDDLAEALARPTVQTEDSAQVKALAEEIAQAEAAEPVTTWDEAVLATLEDLKLDTRGQLHAFGLLPEAWNALIDLVQTAVRAGRKLDAAVAWAIAEFKRLNSGVTFDEAGAQQSLLGNRSAAVPPRYAIGKPIKGPTGASIVGYEWRSTMGEKWSNREGGYVEARVSDWDNADESTGTGRSIVHVFYVKHPDGTVKPEGIRSAQNVLGITEARLMTIAKKEQAAQRYAAEQERLDVEMFARIAKDTPAEAARDYRKANYSPMRTFEENDQIYNKSVLFEKAGKFVRRGPNATERMEKYGWHRVGSPAPAANPVEAALDKAIAATNLKQGELLEGITGAPVWLTKSALNGLLRIIRATYRGTKSLAQAIQAGLEWLRAQNLPNYSETEARAWLETKITTRPEDDDINVREFSDQLAADQPLPPDPARMVANLLYDRRTNESDAAFAARVMEAVGGPAQAVDVFTDATNGLPGSVRMFLGQLIIKAFGVAGQHDQAARFYDETFAGHVTDVAQSLQSLNAFLALTPEGKLIWARRKIERAARDIIAPVQPQLDAAKQELDNANKAGIEETTAAPDVQDAAREAVDTALEKQAQTPGTELQEAIRAEVLDHLVKAGLLTAREAEIFRLHLEGTADNSTLAQKLERAGIPLHDKRADAINQLYKAKTKTEREKIRAMARKARQQPKPPRQQRQPTQEDWIKKARSIPSREIEAAALKLKRALEPSQPRRSPALQEFYQRLTTRLKALLPEQAKAPSQALSDEQLLREVFTNPEKYAEVWAQLGTEIRAKYGVEGMADLTNTLGALSPEGIVQQTMEGNLDRIIRAQMQQLRVQFGQLIRQHYTQQAATAGTLTERIVSSIGLAEADAAKLALVVQRRFAQLVTKTKQAALEKLLKPVKPIAKPALIEKLVTLSNLGALTQEQFWNAVRSNLDLPAWSNELAERIRAQVDVIERIPADQIERKQKAQIDLLNTVERAKGLDGFDLGLAFYITNILTGVTTHLKNLGSTFLNASGAIGSEAARALATGRLDDIPLLLEAIGQGVKRGKLAAGDVLRTGVVTGSRLTKLEPGRALELTQFGKRGGVPVRGTISKAILENRLAGILNLWKYNFRIMGAEDMLFFKPAEEAKAVLLAKRIARSEGLRGEAAQDRARQIMGYGLKAVETARAQAVQEGLTGPALARRTAELLNNNRPLELREDARQFALRTTFNNDPYGALGFVAHLLNQAKSAPNKKVRMAANLITPFTNIIANVVNESLNYTPVGALRARWSGNELLGYQKAKLTVQQQADLKAELYSKALVGTALLTAVALKAAGDLDDEDPDFAIYGAGPAQATDRQGLEAKGWTAHTIKIGDRYYNYANTPLALPMAWLGGISDRIRDARLFGNRSAQRTAESLPLMAASSAVGMGKVITEQSFMVGLMDLSGMLSAPSPEAGGRQMLKQVTRMGSSVVIPNAVRQVDKFFDPAQYEQRTAEGILVNAIPFVRGAHGQPALNALGLPITRPLGTQFTSSQADAPPLVKFLAESGNWPTLPDRNHIYPRTGRTMSEAEYYDYVKGSGVIAWNELAGLVKDRQWPTLNAQEQAQMISETISTAREMWRYDHGW